MVHTVRIRTSDFHLETANRLSKEVKIDGDGEILYERHYCPQTAKRLRVSLTENKATQTRFLSIEGELPSLISNDPLYHLKDTDLNEVVSKIRALLDEAGIDVDDNAIRDAQIKRVDFKSDIKVRDVPSRYIAVLQKCELGTINRHNTNADTVSFVCDDYEVSAYNKTRQMKDIHNTDVADNILRFEVRLKTQRVIERQFGHKNVTLASVFSQVMADEIIASYFDRIDTSAASGQNDHSFDDRIKTIVKALNEHNIVRNRGLTALAALYLPAFREMLGNSTRELVSLLCENGIYDKQQAKRDINALKLIIKADTSPIIDPLLEIRSKLVSADESKLHMIGTSAAGTMTGEEGSSAETNVHLPSPQAYSIEQSPAQQLQKRG